MAGSKTNRNRLRAGALVALIAGFLSTLILTAMPAPRSSSIGKSSYTGTGVARMQQVTVQARVGRVQYVPANAGREIWAVAHSGAGLAGWSTSSGGQSVFMRNLNRNGWEIMGPPKTASGAAFNPTLHSFTFAPNGEGWAVGEDAVMLHRSPGSSQWREAPEAEAVAGKGSSNPAALNSVSLVAHGSGVAGFAVGVTGGAGAGSTILKYRDGAWSSDTPGADMVTDGSPELAAVATVSRDEAWAITGSGSEALHVYHRTAAGWEAVAPDSSSEYPTFGGPKPNVPAQMRNGGLNDAAFGGAVAADSSGAWVGGQMFPRDALHPQGSDTGGDKSRPFMLRFSPAGMVSSYCPDQYGARQQSESAPDPTATCDKPFPFTIYDITSISLVSSDEVFAGGLGLFHFKDGRWSREPDSTGYVISSSFASDNEGWVATSGNTFGAGGAIASSENSLGHWTATPLQPRVARWPQPQHEPVQAVAIAPDGSGRALAVGRNGVGLAYARDVGWDYLDRTTLSDLHGVAWQDASAAWAVGAQGAIQRFDGRQWKTTAESAVLTRQSLFGVAFAGTRDGVAVGAGGTILRFDGSSWKKDPASGKLTSETLYAIDARAEVMIAVGSKGTLIERVGGVWTKNTSIGPLVAREQSVPTLNSVSIAPDGTAVAAGVRGSLIVRHPGRSFENLASPLEGNILAIGISKDASGLRMFASVEPKTGPDAAKYSGDKMFATRSVLMSYKAGLWRDISFWRARTIYNSTDSASYIDPVYSIALESADSAWVVGGISESQPDAEHPARIVATSAVYRVEMKTDPSPRFSVADVSFASKGVNLAFLSETWCERGPCGMTMGTGTQADLVAGQIRKEVDGAARMKHGPKFAVFGGNGRSVGIPEELVELHGYLRSFSIPTYGVIGNHDLLGGVSLPGQQEAGGLINAIFPGSGVDTDSLSVGTHEYWKEVFADAPSPWGSGPLPSEISIKAVRLPTSPDPSSELARTHYAFDYMRGTSRLFRMVMIDSATRSYGRSADQNPEEDQRAWVPDVLRDASLAGLPTIIVMNQPTILPDRTPHQNWSATDSGTFSTDVVTYQVSAILTGGARMNVRDGLPSVDQAVVPIYIMGGAGAPLGYDKPNPSVFDASKLASDGYYNAWFAINVDPDVPCPLGVRCTAKVSVTSFPILESLAMHAWDGASASAGNTLRFSAQSAALTGGVSDIEQSKATHYDMGYAGLSVCEGVGQANGICASRDAIRPPFRFYSEDPSIVDFVVPAVGSVDTSPLRHRVSGAVVRDPGGSFGLLCTFKLGTTFINIESGFKRARMKISVGGGFGPCVDKPVPGPPAPPPFGPQPQPEPPPKPFLKLPPPPLEAVSVVLPPAPAPIVAPAPPAGAAGSKQEKREAQFEEQGEEDEDTKAQFRAIPVGSRRNLESQAPYLLPVAAGLLGFIGAIGAASVRGNRRPRACTIPINWDN